MRAEQQPAVHVDREVLDLAGEEIGLRGYLPEPGAGGLSAEGGEPDETDGRKRPHQSNGHMVDGRDGSEGEAGRRERPRASMSWSFCSTERNRAPVTAYGVGMSHSPSVELRSGTN